MWYNVITIIVSVIALVLCCYSLTCSFMKKDDTKKSIIISFLASVFVLTSVVLATLNNILHITP